MKKLMIIGATWEQLPLIQTAKKKGYYVVATDANPEAIGLQYADVTEQLDPRDLSKALVIAKKHQVEGAVADECDYSHYAATYVNETLGFPTDGIAAAQFTTNKRWMRERCREHHILQPRFVACRTLEEVEAAAELIGLPVIIKPTDNRGSFGVHKVEKKEDLKAAYLDSLLNAHSREVLVEAFIEGIHLTVDGCMDQRGEHHNLAIASKKVMPGDKPIITEVLYPAAISQESIDHVLKTNSAVIEALQIKRGATHSEYVLDDKGRCFLLETATRGGGVLTSAKIIPEVSNVNISELIIANAMKEKYEINLSFNRKAAMLTFFIFPPGKVKSIEGLDQVNQMPELLHIQLSIKPGDTLLPMQSGADRHGFAIITSENTESLQKMREVIFNTIKIQYE
ncbi:ATP-grasp domain-containing protein [Leptospira yasudae]|uniref:ATP-grasp domain-containing protein n=1 Tax=Leptospira yasudae TaxID=2202201 RepID=A0ABX9M0W6_9LEPT|nr:ATP-grasp domain-containing protein [Leptospira yasudae]RHX78268.1 hypothetical protein DLM77_17695 [Leptospira yasudae]